LPISIVHSFILSKNGASWRFLALLWRILALLFFRRYRALATCDARCLRLHKRVRPGRALPRGARGFHEDGPGRIRRRGCAPLARDEAAACLQWVLAAGCVPLGAWPLRWR